MEARLTKDADKLLAMIYRNYLDKRKDGVDRDVAKRLGSSQTLKETLSLPYSLGDVDSFCMELHDLGYLHVLPADNTVYHASLTNAGIARLENRFTDGLKSVVEFLTKFI